MKQIKEEEEKRMKKLVKIEDVMGDFVGKVKDEKIKEVEVILEG